MKKLLGKIQNYPLGIFSWFGYVIPINERLKLIKEAGFDVTTLWWEDEEGIPGFKKEDMPALVRDSGLILENIHMPYEGCNDLWSNSNTINEKIINKHISWLEDCAKYDVPIMVMHITEGVDIPRPTREGMAGIEKIVKKAEELKIILAIENLQRTDYLDLIFSEIKSDYLGFCYDSSHDWLHTGKKADILKRWGHLLVTTHISDNDGKKDRHWIPREGIIDWEKVYCSFPKDKYYGCLTLEAFPMRGCKRNPDVFLKEALKRIEWVRDLFTGKSNT